MTEENSPLAVLRNPPLTEERLPLAVFSNPPLTEELSSLVMHFRTMLWVGSHESSCGPTHSKALGDMTCHLIET